MKVVNRVRAVFLLVLFASYLVEFGLFIDQKFNLLLEIFLTTVVGFILIPFFLDWLVLKDIKIINDFVEKVRYGNLECSLPVREQEEGVENGDEIDELRRSLNWMVWQIHERDARIKEELDRVELLNRELRHESITDKLTGLYNYCYFWEQIRKAFSGYKRENRPFCFVIIDIDYFKKINDTYGHPAGDVVLREVAAILKNQVRETDVPARIGGEEFGVILEGVDESGAASFLIRLQDVIRNSSFQIADGCAVNITVSMGFVSVEKNEIDSAEEMVKLADDALYWVKRNGRNNIMNWNQIRKTA